jgi:hypothetical protein
MLDMIKLVNRLLGIVVFLILQPITAQVYERIFDGVSLKGWHQTGKGTWTVKDSVLSGTMPIGNPESYLISDFTGKDFSLRLKFQWIKGNSGVNFRNEQKGELAMGIQSDIEGGGTSGCLYDNVKGAYVAKTDSIAKWYKPNEWNDLVINAKGTMISVSLNGKKTVEYADLGGRPEGIFAFQLHVGMVMDVKFKDIEMLDYAKPAYLLKHGQRKRKKEKPHEIQRGRILTGSLSTGMDGKFLLRRNAP